MEEKTLIISNLKENLNWHSVKARVKADKSLELCQRYKETGKTDELLFEYRYYEFMDYLAGIANQTIDYFERFDNRCDGLIEYAKNVDFMVGTYLAPVNATKKDIKKAGKVYKWIIRHKPLAIGETRPKIPSFFSKLFSFKNRRKEQERELNEIYHHLERLSQQQNSIVD